MELVTDSDIYCPTIDESGKYADKVPNFNNIKNGLRCPCGSRKDKVYSTHVIFSTHIKTKTHKKWLDELNLNCLNYYIENQKMKEIISQQRLIIARLEKDLSNRAFTVDYLTNELHRLNIVNAQSDHSDLINFD